MINHTRTLLLNQPGPLIPNSAFPGEEYIPPYAPNVNLPAYINSTRNALFGANPDRLMLAYRLRQFMRIINDGPLFQFVLAQDPRITYSLTETDLIANSIYTPSVSMVSGTLEDRITVLGIPAVPDIFGQTYYAYLLSLTGINTVEIQTITQPIAQTVVSYDISTGVSAPIALPGSGYNFVVNSNNPDAVWFVEISNRPQFDLSELVANMDSVGAPTIDALLGIDSAEPYQTFRNLWTQQKELPLRLGAILLALAYRTDALRGVANGS